jgi:hypothetical protein
MCAKRALAKGEREHSAPMQYVRTCWLTLAKADLAGLNVAPECQALFDLEKRLVSANARA